MAKIIVAKNPEQFVLVPSVGFIVDEDGFYLALVASFYCVNIRLWKKSCKKE